MELSPAQKTALMSLLTTALCKIRSLSRGDQGEKIKQINLLADAFHNIPSQLVGNAAQEDLIRQIEFAGGKYAEAVNDLFALQHDYIIQPNSTSYEDEGNAAFQLEQELSDCPYPAYSNESHDWIKGWATAAEDARNGWQQRFGGVSAKLTQSNPRLEHVIARVAKQRLTELESYSKEHDTIADVQSRFSELTGLTELAKLQDNGLSELVIKQLDDIDAEALKIMRDLAQ